MSGFDEMEVARLYLVELKSTMQIAEMLNTNYSKVRNTLLKAGVQMRTWRHGLDLAKDRLGSGNRGMKFQYGAERRRNVSLARQKWAEKNARGVTLKPSGYLAHTRGPNKYRSVHVVIAEEKLLGRRIRPGEAVHHIDGNKLNNDVSNLVVLSVSEHARIHAYERLSSRERDHHGRFR